MTMSKRDAICACRNIIELVGDLQERLPDQYADSVENKITSMCEFIETKWASEYITAKMDSAICNTWEGLRKWDRNDEYNDDLFAGLANVLLKNDTKDPETAAVIAARATKRGLADEVVHEPVVAATVLDYSTLTQHREHIISDVCRTFEATNNRLITLDHIRHGDILQILKKTASERNIQLIEAAFAAGKVAGAYLLMERLKTHTNGK